MGASAALLVEEWYGKRLAEFVVSRSGMGSFDCVTASLRETVTPLSDGKLVRVLQPILFTIEVFSSLPLGRRR